jgi:hypothetical protein
MGGVSPPLTSHQRLLAAVVSIVLVGACNQAAPTPTVSGPAPEVSVGTESPATAPSTAGAGLPAGQTDTDWGRIWDDIPATFPIYPGAAPAGEVQAGPVSAIFAIDGWDARTVAAWMRAELERAAYRTEALTGPSRTAASTARVDGRGRLPDRGRSRRSAADHADRPLWSGLPEPVTTRSRASEVANLGACATHADGGRPAESNRPDPVDRTRGDALQTAQPRDIAALALVGPVRVLHRERAPGSPATEVGRHDGARCVVACARSLTHLGALSRCSSAFRRTILTA